MKKLILFISLFFSLISSSQPYTCVGSRPQINAQLISIGNLSQTRHGVAVASAGNKILFAGGFNTNMAATDRVDIYDITTQSWTTSQLSVGRCYMATVASGNKIFFAGGSPDASGGNASKVVDIYDVVSNTWSIAALSEAGYKIVAAAVGDNVLFAGGTGLGGRSTNVDIYNIQTKSWSTTNLPLARVSGHSAVSANGKVYIAGGNGLYNGSVDIYDNATTSWSTWTMSEAKADFAGIALGSKIYWAGGEVSYLICGGFCGNLGGGTYSSCQVEIRDGITGASSYQQIRSPATWRNYNGQNAVEINGKIIFLGKSSFPNYFDIYDTATNSWSVGILPQGIENASIISVNNVVYVAGGEVNNVLSDQVYKLQFNTILPLNLLNFSAEVLQNNIKTKWKTEN